MHEEIPGVAVDGPPPPEASPLDDGNRVRSHADGLASLDADARGVLADPSLEELKELYEIRFMLEPLATEIATARLSDEELAGLGRIVAQMRDASPTRFVELNREFHGRIHPAAARPRLSVLIDGLVESAADYVRMNIDRYDPAYREEVQAEHEAILTALRSRAPTWAANAVRLHLEHSGRHVADLIEKSNG
jgi:DNA-binding GntR family transcriptional regulator